MAVDEFCQRSSTGDLLAESDKLDEFWRSSENLYERVRALLFLYAIHRFHLPNRTETQGNGLIPFEATNQLLRRRFEEAVDTGSVRNVQMD